MAGMIAQLLLVTALLGIISLSSNGLSPAGWVVGIACGVTTNLGLARALLPLRRRSPHAG